MKRRKPFSLLCLLALLVCGGLVWLPVAALAVKYQVSILDPDNTVKEPFLNNQGEIVWCDKKQGDTTYGKYQIFYYDVRQGGSPRVISLAEKEHTLPQINDQGQVIWLTKVTENDYDIYYWDARLGGSATNLSARPNLEDKNPRLNQQGRVVWQGWDGQDWEIFYYNTVAGGSWKCLTNNNTNDINPVISPTGEVVWQGYDPFGDLYYWKPGLTQPLRITNNPYEEKNPQFAGAGRLFWQGFDGEDEEIYYWNATTQQTLKVTDNPYVDTDLVCNLQGQAAWMGYDGSTYRIYYWDAQKGGTPKVLYNTGLAQKKPKINNRGQVIWLGYDGQYWELYFADVVKSGFIFNVSGYSAETKDKDVLSYAINDKEQVIWVLKVYDSQYIWYWHFTFFNYYIPYKIICHEYAIYDLYGLNNQGQIIWIDYHFKDLYLAEPALYYCDYEYHFGNGDYYVGKVVVGLTHSYYPGKTWSVTDENNLTGYYKVNAIYPDMWKVSFNAGNVFVDNYFDSESKKTFTPIRKGQVVGTNYLGSELDYILRDGVAAYKFGKGYYEADVGDRYTFRYYYTNGDYYFGYVYRSPSASGYYPGRKIVKKNELGKEGYYEILSMSYTGATDKYGQVFVSYYKDSESNKGFIPVHHGQAVGTNYLGSELDYILKDQVIPYEFGQGYYEADAFDKYLFRYYYGNGDIYSGSVYQAPSASGYYPGQVIKKKNELGLEGYYHLYSFSWSGDSAKYGQVFVNYYYDSESKKGFTPVRQGQAVGTNYLGSELDHIIKSGVDVYKFGRGYYEADVGDKYFFSYVYLNRDYYQGYVYRAPSASGYYPGQVIYKKNELGYNGYYYIRGMAWTGDTAKYGQVYVTSYYDGDAPTPKSYTPVNATSPLGTSYLGSELGYIINTTNPNYLFGKGYYEADGLYLIPIDILQ